MPDGRHDLRMRPAWAALDRRELARRAMHEHRRQRTMNRTTRHGGQQMRRAHA